MKIAVCAKQIPDPANPIEYSNGNVVRPEEQVLDDTDRYGIEVALLLKEKYDAEVTVISMTNIGTEKGIQQALQMGPDKALVLQDDTLVGSNSLMTSNVLSELAKIVEADIIIFGTESTVPHNNNGTELMHTSPIARFISTSLIQFLFPRMTNAPRPTYSPVSAVLVTCPGFTQNTAPPALPAFHARDHASAIDAD